MYMTRLITWFRRIWLSLTKNDKCKEEQHFYKRKNAVFLCLSKACKGSVKLVLKNELVEMHKEKGIKRQENK